MKNHQGFTLIEVLVVITLLSLLMLGMSSALYAVGQTETRINAQVQRIEHQRQIQQLLGQLLGQISAQKWRHSSLPEGSTFEGLLATPNNLEWVGTLPPRHGSGGRYFFRLFLDRPNERDAPRLILQYQAWDANHPDADRFPPWDHPQQKVLAEHITNFEIKARSQWPPGGTPDPNWSPQWQTTWTKSNALPEHVSLTITQAQRPWPPMVIAVLPSSGTAERGDGFVIGGSR